MTRFLMSLEDALDLVLFAFANAKQGDIFIQKAPASTVKNLSLALISLMNIKAQIITIGTRHGEKLYETLISREEMVKCENLGRFYRIPIDNRELNYENYFSCGLSEIEGYSDYTSHNAKQLNINDLTNLLLNTNEVKDSLYV